MATTAATYYVKSHNGLLELRQTRFIGLQHPHDLCGVARNRVEMEGLISIILPKDKDAVDWSRIEKGE